MEDRQHVMEATDDSDEDTMVLLRSRNSKRLPPQMSEKIVSSLKSISTIKKQSLNLVLCGSRGPVKALAHKAFLNQKELRPGSTVSEYGWVSLADLPALYGKPKEAVMKKTDRYISLSDPDGVHIFMLALPVGPLTDEDKRELKTIKKTFSSQINTLTTVLFMVESDQTAADIDNLLEENKDIQELIQSCDGRYFILNINDRQQIPVPMDATDKERAEDFRYYTKDNLAKAEMEKTVVQEKTDARAEARLQSMKQWGAMGGDNDSQGTEGLRMVLIGKTGSGKSSTANTILGKKVFTPRVAPKQVKTNWEKETGVIDGRTVTVVNTPGLYHMSLSNEEIQEELFECFSLVAPGPHVFLLVLQIGFISPEERHSVELIKRVFGEKSKDFIIIIFTRGEDLEDESIQSYIEGCEGFVKELVDDCGGRYQVFKNKEKKNRQQVRELLTKIENMVKENGGSYYNAEMFQLAKEVVKREQRVSKRQQEEMAEMKKKLEALEREKQQNWEAKKHEEIEEMKKKLEALEREKQQNWEAKKHEEIEEMKKKLEALEREKQENKRAKKQHEEIEEMKKKLEALEREKRHEIEKLRLEMNVKLSERANKGNCNIQ